jgi:hypothetical protein
VRLSAAQGSSHKWPDDDFDSIWVLELDQANVWSFSRERQSLLDGDDTGQMG